MKEICFLIADTYLKDTILHTLTAYYPEWPKGTLPKIEIIDFPRLVPQAKELLQTGTKVIITNSGAHQILQEHIKSIPLLCLYSSTPDVLYTLSALEAYRKIHLLLNKNFMFRLENCPPRLREKLQLYPPYKAEAPYEHLLSLIRKIPPAPATALVGCTLLPQIAPRLPFPTFPIYPGESVILSALNYARELLNFQRHTQRQLSIVTSILSHVEEGIILHNAEGRISHLNKKTEQFFQLSQMPQHIRQISPDLHRTTAGKETLITRPPYTLVATADTFKINKETHTIITLRDITKLQRLEKNIRYKLTRTGLTATHTFAHIHTVDPEMKRIIALAQKFAAYNEPLLIQGDSGTGKELFAQSIHNAGPRRHGPFVVVNCAALPPELLESELFGYVGGAFTGARKEGKIGYFELAHTGTIFLDEINSMSPAIQSKLLRVLENKQIMRIGSDYVIPLDIRIISAANTDILQAVRENRFRRDLFFRLHTLTLNLPSLNERPADILYLFSLFTEKIAGRPAKIPPALQQVLQQHCWWGNIRELYSVALRYHILAPQTPDRYDELFDTPHTVTAPPEPTLGTINLKQLHRDMDNLIIQELLRQGFSKTRIAQLLQISRQTLFNKERNQ